jgi:hypothetical protein
MYEVFLPTLSLPTESMKEISEVEEEPFTSSLIINVCPGACSAVEKGWGGRTEPVFVSLLRSPGIDSQPGGLFDVPARQAT